MNLTGTKIFLRNLSADDLEYLYTWENTPAVWQWGDCGFAADLPHAAGVRPSATPGRFSRDELRKFIENQQHDISETGQIRFVICRRTPASPPLETDALHVISNEREKSALYGSDPVGFIDLFDLDPATQSAGVGILICDPADRRKGYGFEALSLAVEYARHALGLRSLWCTVAPDNPASLALFTAAGFTPADSKTHIGDTDSRCAILIRRIFSA